MTNCFQEQTAPDPSLVGMLEFYERAIRKKRAINPVIPSTRASRPPSEEQSLPSIIVDERLSTRVISRRKERVGEQSRQYMMATLLFAAGAFALVAVATTFGYL